MLSAREYVVSMSGDDAAAGTREAPFRTIAKASAVLEPGDVCLVRAGTYRETIRPRVSGERGKPITYRAWPGERPVLSGLEPLASWERVKGDLWRAPMRKDLGQFNQLFIDGKPGQEARWPNKKSADPLDWDAMDFDSGSCNEYLLCKNLPERPDGYWKGATLWVMAGAKWTSWSTSVDGYVSAEKKILFKQPPKQGSIATNMSPAERRGGFFFLVGLQGEIDQEGEWAVNATEKKVYLQVAPGMDPNTQRIEMKQRREAATIFKLSHIVIEGFAVLGAKMRVEGGNHCLLRDIRAHWVDHLRGGNTGYGLNKTLGFSLSGENNIIRDSEIAYSAGNGIKVGGKRSAVINCWVHHTDYSGSYDAPIKLWGQEILLSHNTIHDTGRDCIQPGGQKHVIQYNNVYNMGRIAHDLGGSYVCGSDGGGTEFHHNWVHDNLAHGTRMGIYLDNFTSNYFVYRNVVWNIKGCDIRLNRPSLHNVVINNTMLGNAGNWGRWQTDWMYGCGYINNAVSGEIKPHPQALSVGNRFHTPEKELNIENFSSYHAGAGKGVEVAGITGSTPGIGAYEPGDDWRAGHDFSNPPNPVWKLADTPLRNLVRHGSFGWTQWRGKLGPWKKTGAKKGKIIWGPGGIVKSYTTRDTIISAGVQLGGAGEDGIEQEISGLKPKQRYEASAWVKCRDGAAMRLEVAGLAGSDIRAESTLGDEWQLLTVCFTTGAEAGKATVRVTKTGGGVGFTDDIGVVGVLPGLEPKLPGFAPALPKRVAKPVRPRHLQALPVPVATGAGVYPGKAVPVVDNPGRTKAAGAECRAFLSHCKGELFVKVEVPLLKKLKIEEDPQWTKSDGLEICFSYPDKNAQHPVFILHGFPNGSCESSTEAGAPAPAAKRLGEAVRYAAKVNDKGWTGEWRIPLATVDISAVPGLELNFNIGIFRRESKQWIQWGGTHGQTWRVDRAGRIRLQ